MRALQIFVEAARLTHPPTPNHPPTRPSHFFVATPWRNTRAHAYLSHHATAKLRQALAAEFPTAAGVRPVYANLVNVYELLRHSADEEEGKPASEGNSGAKDAAEKHKRDSQRAMLPFEGRLLVFHRGNGVEETKGRLLLKKLDFLQVHHGGVLLVCRQDFPLESSLCRKIFKKTVGAPSEPRLNRRSRGFF